MFGDIARAIGQLGDPRFLAVLLKALAVTLLLLAGCVWMFLQIALFFLPDSVSLPGFGTFALDTPWLSWGMMAVALLISVFVMIPLASVLVGLFVEDVARAVEDRHYPHLPPANGQGWGEMVWDTARFLALMLIVNAFAIIFYFFATVFAPFVFLAVNGLLLGREYFYLVAARRVGVRQARTLFRSNFLEIWVTGAVMALPLTVPGLNLIVPVLGVAAFTHQYHRLSGEGRGDRTPR